jgi:muramoyltetrapeptide carboxypeptidase
MRIIKPKALKHGDVIGIAAPASPPSSEDKLHKGIRYLEHLGYRIELGKHIYNRRGYLAGTDLNRASDLHQLFRNKKVKAIFTARGGYGCQRLVPLLDYDLIKRNTKILVGYSDISVLHLSLFAKTGLITFSGPMVAVEMATGISGKAEEQFWECLTSTKPLGTIHGERKRIITIPHRGTTTGRLLGGNLSLIAALLGTPYFPSFHKSILLLEEIGEQPYRIDRLLHQLKLGGIFHNVNGVMLGEFTDCNPKKGKESLTLKEVFQDIFRDEQYPIASGFNFGHVKNSLTLPIGVRIRLNAVSGKVQFLETSVS